MALQRDRVGAAIDPSARDRHVTRCLECGDALSLSATRRVIAFDIAGFGLTPPLPRGTLPTIANLVDGLEQSIHDDGHRGPGGHRRKFARRLHGAGGGKARDRAERRRDFPAGLWKEHPRASREVRVRGSAIHGETFSATFES